MTSAQATLFENSTEMIIQRLDTEILSLILGHSGGPMKLQLGIPEKAVLTAIRFRRGLANAIKLREISERTKLSDREIKEAVRTLRLSFHLPIGSSKHSTTGGYYLMISAEDRSTWRRDVLDQVRAQIEVLRAADGRQGALEALGQLSAELMAAPEKSEGADAAS